MGRAGIQPGEPAVALSKEIDSTPGLRFQGLMTWEGHTVWIDDVEKKKVEVERSIQEMLKTAEDCRKAGLPVSILSCGGSGTYLQSAQVEGITEVQAGGAVFTDVTYRKWGTVTEPALFIRTTVTSRPTTHRIVCDAGFKTMPAWLNAPHPLGVEGVDRLEMYAEHGVLHLTHPNSEIKVGHTLDFVPAYGDITVFLHDRMYGFRGNRVEEIWPVGRPPLPPPP
jgi:D-serine deaminase-like pyridoxal phosphate-dependent protein